MPEHENAATVARDDVPRVPPLPDLTGLGLRALREAGDRALAAAVERALSRPAELAETWYSGGSEAGATGAAR
ncbi:hypothetical protein [Streptomyces griseocarneus]|uniref:hypothetical protein n=1 Tax=Streptomyces griseocarneus TaxID=51201 RepID=UPI00167E76A5|nr:hypothetical protein [Streptomyces griseocarneus]MBZ6473443.1 hypothetical protein [Streptomyces griseocarneus]